MPASRRPLTPSVPATTTDGRPEEIFGGYTLRCTGLPDAIPKVLQLIRDKGRIVYVRGEPNREILGLDIVLADPTDRLPVVAGRRPITAFCLVEFLWYCGQRNDLASLEAYAPNITSYYWGLDHTVGSNYGWQLFSSRDGRSQWENVIDLLRADPGSKRAFLGIYDASLTPTLLPQNRDVSCTIGFQALIRESRLHWVTSMRANDAFRGFVSDTFSFTMFHELLARTLEVSLGDYLHRPTSFHTYPEDEAAIDRILEVKARSGLSRSGRRMPPVEPETLWGYVADFWAIHDRCRTQRDWRDLQALKAFGSSWWRWVGSVLGTFIDRETSLPWRPSRRSRWAVHRQFGCRLAPLDVPATTAALERVNGM